MRSCCIGRSLSAHSYVLMSHQAARGATSPFFYYGVGQNSSTSMLHLTVSRLCHEIVELHASLRGYWRRFAFLRRSMRGVGYGCDHQTGRRRRSLAADRPAWPLDGEHHRERLPSIHDLPGGPRLGNHGRHKAKGRMLRSTPRWLRSKGTPGASAAAILAKIRRRQRLLGRLPNCGASCQLRRESIATWFGGLENQGRAACNLTETRTGSTLGVETNFVARSGCGRREPRTDRRGRVRFGAWQPTSTR